MADGGGTAETKKGRDDATAEDGARARKGFDTYALHFPPAERTRDDFDRGVGSEGYERGTGGQVPRRPVLRRRPDDGADAEPFDR